jgi:peptide/nickel transport system permease protein
VTSSELRANPEPAAVASTDLRPQAVALTPLLGLGVAELEAWMPNVADLMAVEFALRASSALLLVSALSFLGLGISPPTPDWGLMVEDAMALLDSEPHLVLAPALAISTLVLGINLAAEGLAEALGLDAARGGASG